MTIMIPVLVLLLSAATTEALFLRMAPTEERSTLQRMQYWATSAIPNNYVKAPTDRYLIFSSDIGGLNNIRIAFENVALMAAYTNRTLVLPAPSPMYLLDFGARIATAQGLKTNTKTSYEELFNIPALKASLPALTWAEFEKQTGLTWKDATAQAGEVHMEDKACKNLPPYRQISNQILLMRGDNDRREGFLCSEWACRIGANHSVKVRIGEPAWALLTHAFPWHPDAFQIAAKAVHHLGLFQYAALHARYNDFAYEIGRQAPEQIMKKWEPMFVSHAKTLYVATDEAWRFRNVTTHGLELIFWNDLFGPSANHELRKTRDTYSPERWFKLQGPVEELICAFASVFVGSDMSSFSGHIQRMRVHAKAPSTARLVHTQQKVPREHIRNELEAWQQHGGASGFTPLPLDVGDKFVDLDVTNHGYL
jgi:hypothetical protein